MLKINSQKSTVVFEPHYHHFRFAARQVQQDGKSAELANHPICLVRKHKMQIIS